VPHVKALDVPPLPPRNPSWQPMPPLMRTFSIAPGVNTGVDVNAYGCFDAFGALIRTTIDLPEDLLRQAKARAALDGKKLKDLLTVFIQEGLRRRDSSRTAARGRLVGRRSPPPVLVPRRGVPIPAVSPDALRQLEDEEDEARHARPA